MARGSDGIPVTCFGSASDFRPSKGENGCTHRHPSLHLAISGRRESDLVAMPRLVVNSFKHGKLENGWSWPLTTTTLTEALGDAVEFDAFLDISFWQQQATSKRERDARLEGRRFRVLELRTALDPSGI